MTGRKKEKNSTEINLQEVVKYMMFPYDTGKIKRKSFEF